MSFGLLGASPTYYSQEAITCAPVNFCPAGQVGTRNAAGSLTAGAESQGLARRTRFANSASGRVTAGTLIGMTSGQPDDTGGSEPDSSTERRISLLWLVTIGTVVVTLLGLALFLWFAWLLSRQPAPLRNNTRWWDWLGHVGGTELFDAARTTATILAIVGVGGAALVAYRRQDTTERAHKVALEGQRIDTAQHTLDSRKYQLELDRRNDDHESDLRVRFATVAEQLGSANFSVRQAGAYALASLADDWQRFGNGAERQVCVDLLCAQLRRPRPKNDLGGVLPKVADQAGEDLEVRKTIVALIRSHRPVSVDSTAGWNVCTLDFAGADLSGFSFIDTDLRSANFEGANLSGVNMIRTDLSDANLAKAKLSGCDFSNANLTGATLHQVSVDRAGEEDVWRNQAVFERATLRGAQLGQAFLPNALFDRADLREAIFHAAKLVEANFTNADLAGARLIHAVLDRADFSGADLRKTNFAYAQVHEAQFTDARHDSETNWARGEVPSGVAPIDELM